MLELSSFSNLNFNYVVIDLRFLLCFQSVKNESLKIVKCDVVLKSWYINKLSGNLALSVLKIMRIKHTNMVQVPINWNGALTLEPKSPPQ